MQRLSSLILFAGCAAGCMSGGTAGPTTPAATPAQLRQTIDRLGAEVSWRSPGTEAALAVVDLTSGARASVGGDVLFVSASSAKAWWVAAALREVGVAPVKPYADAIFVESDNGATGDVIDSHRPGPGQRLHLEGGRHALDCA